MCCSHALGLIFRTIAQIIFSLYMHTHTQNNSHLFLVYFSIADALPYGLWLWLQPMTRMSMIYLLHLCALYIAIRQRKYFKALFVVNEVFFCANTFILIFTTTMALSYTVNLFANSIKVPSRWPMHLQTF